MELLRVTDRNSRVYADTLAIVRDSISSDAQLPEQRLSDLLARGNYRLFAYVHKDDVQGADLVYFSERVRFAWLDYFAIRSDLRGRGLGSRLFREIVQVIGEREPSTDWLLLEVDDDREGDSQHQEICARRIEFYRRLGARLLENVPYKFPSAFTAPIPMRLMVCQLHPDAKLTPDDLKHAVREVFLNIHGRASDDELLRWFGKNLPDRLQMT